MFPWRPQEWQVFTYSAGPPSSGRCFSMDACASQFLHGSVMTLTLGVPGERHVDGALVIEGRLTPGRAVEQLIRYDEVAGRE